MWFFSAITMVVVRFLTTPPQYKVTDDVFASAAEQSLGGPGYRFWAGVLFVCTLILWAAFVGLPLRESGSDKISLIP